MIAKNVHTSRLAFQVPVIDSRVVVSYHQEMFGAGSMFQLLFLGFQDHVHHYSYQFHLCLHSPLLRYQRKPSETDYVTKATLKNTDQ